MERGSLRPLRRGSGTVVVFLKITDIRNCEQEGGGLCTKQTIIISMPTSFAGKPEEETGRLLTEAL